MDSHTPTTVDPHELDRARAGWSNFTQFAKMGIVSIVALLVLMAIFLL